MTIIPLPSVSSNPNATAHPFPFQIAMQALRFMQAATFYSCYADVATGLYQRSDANAISKIKAEFIKNNLSEQAWNTSLDCLAEYFKYLPNPVFQNALFAMLIHWDWYVLRLGQFIRFASEHVEPAELNQKTYRTLKKLDFLPIVEQIQTLGDAANPSLLFDPTLIANIQEMTLVRNLGMHHQWEVSPKYMKTTKTKNWEVGQTRQITINELEGWRVSLGEIINKTSDRFARMYVSAPSFDYHAAADPV